MEKQHYSVAIERWKNRYARSLRTQVWKAALLLLKSRRAVSALVSTQQPKNMST